MCKHRLLRCVCFGCIVLTGVVIGSLPLYAAELHVAQDGSGDFFTIQQAADVVQAGDTVIIHQGVYPEIVQPVNSGTAGSPITYRSETGDDVVIDGGAGARDVCIKVQSCSHLRFEGLTLSGALWAGFYSAGWRWFAPGILRAGSCR